MVRNPVSLRGCSIGKEKLKSIAKKKRRQIWEGPMQIAKGILVNHFGTVITCEPFVLPPDGYLDIDWEQDWEFSGGDCQTVAEFKKRYLGNAGAETGA